MNYFSSAERTRLLAEEKKKEKVKEKEKKKEGDIRKREKIRGGHSKKRKNTGDLAVENSSKAKISES